MVIKIIPAGIYGANCYVLMDEDSKEAVILDPGGDSDIIIKNIETLGGKPKYILLTHGHVDHVDGVMDIKDKYNIPYYINKEDETFIEKGTYIYGRLPKADGYLKEGDTLTFGKEKIQCIHTPGHTPGGMCFLIGDKVFTGDTLFQESIGRTDFEGGNYNEIISSINNRLIPLGDKVEVYPGHGPKTSILQERTRNPFLNNSFLL
ncbi:MBL fold hydrolase [Clostridium polyendosporum]|uniref:MBL fold hydrolase n=1 Tax=Clostridium polyendosporum TaxID=69208 RepID=A0A919RYK1_9CLOT|nr:MBL fold metallo-hydrolase [Clostridium polyendosporum]GIM28644.1 MBL fold hydrolase [Clostridium polyendosporum]